MTLADAVRTRSARLFWTPTSSTAGGGGRQLKVRRRMRQQRCRDTDRQCHNFGTYSAQRAATSRCRPVAAGHPALAQAFQPSPPRRRFPQVRSRIRTSGPASATMHHVPAGVAQQAEQPSCKRQVSGSTPLTGSAPPECLAALSCPQDRLPLGRVAGRGGEVDMAQPAARVLYYRAERLEAGRQRRVPAGRAQQCPGHLRDVCRERGRRAGAGPPGHRPARALSRSSAGDALNRARPRTSPP